MIHRPNVAIPTRANGITTTDIINQTIADTFVQLFESKWQQEVQLKHPHNLCGCFSIMRRRVIPRYSKDSQMQAVLDCDPLPFLLPLIHRMKRKGRDDYQLASYYLPSICRAP